MAKSFLIVDDSKMARRAVSRNIRAACAGTELELTEVADGESAVRLNMCSKKGSSQHLILPKWIRLSSPSHLCLPGR